MYSCSIYGVRGGSEHQLARDPPRVEPAVRVRCAADRLDDNVISLSLSLFLYKYAYIYMCIYIYIYMYTYVYN